MHVSLATAPGSSDIPQSDWAAATPNLVVIGGSVPTLMGLGAGAGCGHGTPWFVRRLIGEIVTHEAAAGNALLRTIVGQSIARVAGIHAEICTTTGAYSPSAALAIVRHRHPDAVTSMPGTVEYFVLADACVVFETANGPRFIADRRIKNLFLTPRRAVLAAPAGSPERESLAAELTQAHQSLRNVRDGYWVATTDPQAAMHASMGASPARQLRAVALMTSGASRLVDPFEAIGWAEAFDLLRDEGPAVWIRRVRDLEATDEYCTTWPRHKTSDDATIAFATMP